MFWCVWHAKLEHYPFHHCFFCFNKISSTVMGVWWPLPSNNTWMEEGYQMPWASNLTQQFWPDTIIWHHSVFSFCICRISLQTSWDLLHCFSGFAESRIWLALCQLMITLVRFTCFKFGNPYYSRVVISWAHSNFRCQDHIQWCISSENCTWANPCSSSVLCCR